MTNNPTPRGDELLQHLIECLRLLDERVQVAVERAIQAREAGDAERRDSESREGY